jgi:hypothetical protein
MLTSLEDKLKQSLKNAVLYHSDLFVKPEVLLWPDPDKQWEPIIRELQKTVKELLVLGDYKPEAKQGPAIYIKCMVARTLPEADWSDNIVPILYIPGLSKNDIKNISIAQLEYQSLMEYQFTGTIWLQENGKEWTINAFLQNKAEGLNLSVSQDNTTRDMLKKALPIYFREPEAFKYREHIDADYLYSIVFPEFIPVLLKWICKGDDFLGAMDEDKQKIFQNICSSRYAIEANYSNIKDIVQKLITRKNNWAHVWQYYSNSPTKYPEIEYWLRQLPSPATSLWNDEAEIETWPQINDEKENELRRGLLSTGRMDIKDSVEQLQKLEGEHAKRRKSVWAEMGKAPLAFSLLYIKEMTDLVLNPFPSSSIEELKEYYITSGYQIDTLMRQAYASVKSIEDKEAVKAVINIVYKPWLVNITNKFQQLLAKKPETLIDQSPSLENEDYILFVDAFRYELAKEFITSIPEDNYSYDFNSLWCALPSLTPTAKPFLSPIAAEVSTQSPFNEFRPQLNDKKDLTFNSFKSAIQKKDITFVTNRSEIKPGNLHWQEFGEIDRKGHEEQSDMVRRIPEQLERLKEVIDSIFSSGINKIKIVTDHGWLLLPGGLPKSTLTKELTETRWGRCAVVKEGVKTELMYLPWHWNKSIHIAYAPCISFFKRNEEYAHGGLSMQECLIPVITLKPKNNKSLEVKINSVKWTNLRCLIEVPNAPEGYLVDIRTKYTDPATSVVLSPNKEIKDGKCTLFVDDEAENHSVAIVLLNDKGIIIDKQIGIAGN